MDKPIVLIVDDEPLIATMVEVVFEEAGFEVYSATDALDASDQIRRLDTRLSALITDIQSAPRNAEQFQEIATRLRPGGARLRLDLDQFSQRLRRQEAAQFTDLGQTAVKGGILRKGER